MCFNRKHFLQKSKDYITIPIQVQPSFSESSHLNTQNSLGNLPNTPTPTVMLLVDHNVPITIRNGVWTCTKHYVATFSCVVGVNVQVYTTSNLMISIQDSLHKEWCYQTCYSNLNSAVCFKLKCDN